jgi:hypothetical protein
MPLSVLRLYSFNDMMIKECGGETDALGENLSQCHTVHHKFHDLTWDRTRAMA